MENRGESETIPLVEEVATLAKREVEGDRVRVRTVVDETSADVVTTLSREDVQIERRTVERAVESAPPPREEGDTLILSLVEERPVIEKRLFVVEELIIRRARRSEDVTIPTTTRSMRAIVERDESDNRDDAGPTSPTGGL